MKFLKSIIGCIGLSIIFSCNSSLIDNKSFDKLVNEESRRTIRYDSIVYGVKLGMTYDDFYYYAFEDSGDYRRYWKDYNLHLNYSNKISNFWISLNLIYSLTGVGLTAKISKILADNEISANIYAGFYHDHIFVQKEMSQKAMKLLCESQ